MGFAYVDVVVHGLKGSRGVRMLVDTGSTYIVLDPKSIDELGLMETPYAVNLVLVDKRVVRARLYVTEVEVKGRRGPAFVAELDAPTPLLGVYALEALGFKVNPRTGELEEVSPEGGYLLALFSYGTLSADDQTSKHRASGLRLGFRTAPSPGRPSAPSLRALVGAILGNQLT